MSLFTEKAPAIMWLLMQDFDLTEEEAAAILGNLGHETGGFKYMQEINPTIRGSRGGFGWAQWTGPRRRAFEAYCSRNKLDPTSDKANYGWLFVELTSTEKKAIPALKAAKGLRNKVIVFERSFERAGHKAYESRYQFAVQALGAYRSKVAPTPVPAPVKPTPTPAPVPAPVPSPQPAPAPQEGLLAAFLAALTGAGIWLVENTLVYFLLLLAAVAVFLAFYFGKPEFQSRVKGWMATAAAVMAAAGAAVVEYWDKIVGLVS